MTKLENREQYEWALSRVEALLNDVTEEMPDNDPRRIEYSILSSLVADYSDEHFDLGGPTLQECLRERMFEQGLSRKDIAALLGTGQGSATSLPGNAIQRSNWLGTFAGSLTFPGQWYWEYQNARCDSLIM